MNATNTNKKSNNNNNNNTNNIKRKPNVQNVFLVSLVGLALLGVGIGLTYMFFKIDVKKERFKDNFSYISKDIVNNKSVFETTDDVDDPNYFNGKTENVNKCIKMCKKTPNCDGMSFNSNTYDCVGYNNGILIKSEPYMYAWEKPQSSKMFSSKIVLSNLIDNQTQLDESKITLPLSNNNFMFSGFITITNWYDSNHGYWKNVLLKGNIESENNRLPKTNKWEDITKVCPQQCIGIWLAPYTNNMRICITTQVLNIEEENNAIPQPNTQSCIGGKCFNNSKVENNVAHQFHKIREDTDGNKEYLEYFDILNVPINKSFFIAINVTNKILEIYMNDKLNYILELKGEPIFNNHLIAAKINPSFSGNIKNLSYVPYSPTHKEIKKIYNKL